MPRFLEEQIEEVRRRSDIVDIIGSYVKLKRSGSSYMGLCPFHNEKSPSFSVSPARQPHSNETVTRQAAILLIIVIDFLPM